MRDEKDSDGTARRGDSSGHTPGPWTHALHPTGPGSSALCVIAQTANHVVLAPAPFGNWIGTDEANAALIAAAPDLLAALTDALSHFYDDEALTACDDDALSGTRGAPLHIPTT